jgi:2-iminobutanoate/2-iminopropanoate deaminase
MMMRILLIAGLLAVVPVVAGDTGRTYIVGDRPANAGTLPFSNGVLVGDRLFVGGHLGLDPATSQAPQNPEVEARLVMDAVKRTVEQAGFKMDDLVSVSVFCTDLGLYDTFNAVYRTYFQGQYPARAFIGAATLLRGAHYEVLGIAVRPSKKSG